MQITYVHFRENIQGENGLLGIKEIKWYILEKNERGISI